MNRDVTLPSDVRSPIFIGGHHRSGTTLMRVMLNRHPCIACGPESELLERTSFLEFHRYFEDTWTPQLERFGFGSSEIDRAMAAFIDAFFTRHQTQRKKRRWAEKTPKNILRIDYLFRLFPHAQFIHMIRDPRDVHCSIQEKARSTTPRWATITPEQTARGWKKRIERGQKWRDDPARYCEVRYEDLVRDPEGAMQSVLAFLDEPWDSHVLEASERNRFPGHSNVTRPIFSSSVSRWQQDLADDDLRHIEAIAGSVMRQIGYQPATINIATAAGK